MIALNKEQMKVKRSFIRMLKEKDLICQYKTNFLKYHRKLINKKIYESIYQYEKVKLINYTYSFNDFIKNFYVRKDLLINVSFIWTNTDNYKIWYDLAYKFYNGYDDAKY